MADHKPPTRTEDSANGLSPGAGGGLTQQAMSGLRWGGVSVAAMVVFQLGLMAVMARLLDPAAFGLMAMANVALRLFAFFAQLGIGAALIQRVELEKADIAFAMGLTLVVCVPATVLTVLIAPVVGWFFNADAVVPLVRVLALGFLVNGMAAIPAALLRRSMRLRAVSLLDMASYLIGYGLVGVCFAWAGAGVWALVAATLGQALVAWIGGYLLVRHPLRPRLRGAASRLLGYGARHSLISFVEFIHANLDTAMIGRLVSDTALGLYNRAMMLAILPVERIATVVGRVLFPLLSAVQTEPAKVGSAWLLGIGVIATASAALCTGLWVAAVEVVAVLLGPRWGDAVPLFRVLVIATPFVFMSNVCGITCDALALLRFKLRLQTACLVALGLLFLICFAQGLVAMAWAIVAVELVRFAVYLVVLGRRLQTPWDDVFRVLVTSALVGASVGAAVAGTRALVLNHVEPIVSLALEAALAAVTFAAAALIALRALAQTRAMSLARDRLPRVDALLHRLRGAER